MDRQIIMSHNLVTQIKNMLTCSNNGTQIAFQRDVMSKIRIRLSIPPMTQELSPSLRSNPISVW